MLLIIKHSEYIFHWFLVIIIYLLAIYMYVYETCLLVRPPIDAHNVKVNDYHNHLLNIHPNFTRTDANLHANARLIHHFHCLRNLSLNSIKWKLYIMKLHLIK